MSKKTVAHGNCPDCDVAPGELHLTNCDIEQCDACGCQRLSCGCQRSANRLPWTGMWPGEAECREFGWWTKWKQGGERGGEWVIAGPNERGAQPDLNRIHGEAVWDRRRKRFVLPKSAVSAS